MAQGSNEHRMVFDIRGRRRHVVKVVYAILAVLMAASLFLVTGAINLNSLFGTASTGESAVSSLEKQAANIEAKLVKSPGDEDLLANLTRTRINVAHTMATGVTDQGGLEEVQQQYAKASEDWSEYLAVAKEPSAGLAIQVAPALFQLAELSSTGVEGDEIVKQAAEAQKVVVERRPSVNSWSTYALYSLIAQDYKAAEEAKEETAKLAPTKFARESFENQYAEVEKNAKEFSKALKAEKAANSKAGAKEALENPLQGLGSTGLGGG